MAIRERTCAIHGYFTKIVPISAPDDIPCPECGGPTSWTPTRGASFTISGKEVIPNSTSDMTEYADWQRDQIKIRTEKLNNASKPEDFEMHKVVDKKILEQAQAVTI